MRAGLSCLVALVVLSIVVPCPAHADPNDLSGGVFIAHAPLHLQYSPGCDWCEKYEELYAISSCEEQNPRIDLDGHLGEKSVWYVIAAWGEEKEWCGTEFGFGSYDPAIYSFSDWGACLPNELEISTTNWPGPNEGTVVVATDSTWNGNFQPVYYFSGYAYAQGRIPLAQDPSRAFGGTGNSAAPAVSYPAAEYGELGLFSNGVPVCPSEEPIQGSGYEVTTVACCVSQMCALLDEATCHDLGGAPLLGQTTCETNICPQESESWPRADDHLAATVVYTYAFGGAHADNSWGQPDSLRTWLRETARPTPYSFEANPFSFRVADDLGTSWSRFAPGDAYGDTPLLVHVIPPPSAHSEWFLVTDGVRGTTMLSVDRSGAMVGRMERPIPTAETGVAISDDGQTVVVLESLTRALSEIRLGGTTDSGVFDLPQLTTRRTIPWFGGLAQADEEGFWIVAYHQDEEYQIKALDYGRIHLVRLSTTGDLILDQVISEQGRPMAMAVHAGRVHIVLQETEGNETALPASARWDSRGVKYASPPELALYSAAAGRIQRETLPDGDRSTSLAFRQTRDGHLALLHGTHVIPIASDGSPLHGLSWDIRAGSSSLRYVHPAQIPVHWDLYLLTATSGWLILSNDPTTAQPLASCLRPQLWFVAPNQANVANNAFATEIDITSAKTALLTQPLVAIEGGTLHGVVCVIANLGLVGLAVR